MGGAVRGPFRPRRDPVARAAWGGAHPHRLRLAGWRFPVLDWLDARLRDRREARARAEFEPVEESALVAQKVNEMTARRKSRRIAEATARRRPRGSGRVARPARARDVGSDPSRAPADPRPDPRGRRDARQAALLDLERRPRGRARAEPPAPPPRRPDGSRARFLLGGLLCALFLLWADQVGIISSTEIREQAERAIAEQDVGQLKDVNVEIGRIHTADEPLRIPGVPESLTRLVSGYGVGAAGLILIVSALVAGSRIAVFALPAAAVAWFGPMLGIPPIGPLAAPAVAAASGRGCSSSGCLREGRPESRVRCCEICRIVRSHRRSSDGRPRSSASARRATRRKVNGRTSDDETSRSSRGSTCRPVRAEPRQAVELELPGVRGRRSAARGR